MRGRWYAAGGIVAVLIVGACTHSSGGGAHVANGQAVNPAGGGVAADSKYEPAQGAPVAAAPARHAAGDLSRADTASRPAAGGPSVQAEANALPLVDGGYKIEVARMTVAVKGAANVANQANQATTIAEQNGGEVDRDDRTSGPDASASMLLRVPPDALTDTLNRLSNLGDEKYRSLSSSDVTQKVADVRSRVGSAQDSIARLRVLFNHATKIGDIIQIESELNSREADLESLQAQQRALARQTSMASITLSLVTAPKHVVPPKPPAKKHHDNAFIGGLKNGWDGFSGAAAWVAKAVGTLLPFIVLLFVLGFAWRVGWPRLRHGSGPTPAPTPSE